MFRMILNSEACKYLKIKEMGSFYNNKISYIAILLSITAICLSIVRCEPLTIDWLGVLVGILALLVTVLLCVQVYQLFDFNERIKNIESKILISVEQNIDELKLDIEGNLANVKSYLLFSHGRYEDSICLLSEGIKNTMKTKNNKHIQMLLDNMEYLLGQIESRGIRMQLADERKLNCISSLASLNHPQTSPLVKRLIQVFDGYS